MDCQNFPLIASLGLLLGKHQMLDGCRNLLTENYNELHIRRVLVRVRWETWTLFPALHSSTRFYPRNI